MSKKFSAKEIAQLKREAKRRARAEGLSFRTTLNLVAREQGFETWKALLAQSEGKKPHLVPFGKGSINIEAISRQLKHNSCYSISASAPYMGDNSPRQLAYAERIPPTSIAFKLQSIFVPKSPSELLKYSAADWIASLARALIQVPEGAECWVTQLYAPEYDAALPALYFCMEESDSTVTPSKLIRDRERYVPLFPGLVHATLIKALPDNAQPRLLPNAVHLEQAKEEYQEFVDTFEVKPDAPWISIHIDE
ncbi:hypothetical protein J8I26_06570 [Herbaspirillum sp. LeCh32-8]|uniref:hypothetical protein n=1 Tax=Herbaspirillum sp. LeCh32-8 TaxID=2821356 RepID=UPI001AE9D1C8|nr:hypothetical protein [Herbaspirillum sp. LeCh32-8]MBP0597757.1 hypothetical protein [Herbaspirillum sp. LeCh32-8]